MPAILIALCVGCLMFRLTLGVDLGDEAYYAAFIDGWLKNGVGNNPNLMVHQTADLLVYPFAAGYRSVRGGEDGLILFLRCIYLLIAVLSVTCLYRAVRQWESTRVAALTAAFALLFIPFGLPAPSYNTIGMYSSSAALSLFLVCFAPTRTRDRRACRLSALWLSAACWAIACTAYPSMLVALMGLISFSLIALRAEADRRTIRHYVIACAILLILAVITTCGVLGFVHVWQMLRFTNTFNNVSGGLAGKLHGAITTLGSHPRFTVLLIAAVLVSGLRSAASARSRALGDVAIGFLILGVATASEPAFFNRSHDLILVLAITGIFPAIRQMTASDSDVAIRAVCVVYCTSLLCGLVTAATALNGLFNFPIGGLLSACISLVMPLRAVGPGAGTSSDRERSDPVPRTTWIRLCVMSGACVAIAATTFTQYYGQIVPLTPRNSVRLTHGVFAGLHTDPDQASFIEQMTKAIQRQADCGSRFAVLSTGPGFYLLTTMSPTTLSTWNFPRETRNFATDAIEEYYAVPKNRPDVLAVNQWQWATPLSQADRKLLDSYVFAERVVVGLYDASLYRRADCGHAK